MLKEEKYRQLAANFYSVQTNSLPTLSFLHAARSVKRQKKSKPRLRRCESNWPRNWWEVKLSHWLTNLSQEDNRTLQSLMQQVTQQPKAWVVKPLRAILSRWLPVRGKITTDRTSRRRTSRTLSRSMRTFLQSRKLLLKQNLLKTRNSIMLMQMKKRRMETNRNRKNLFLSMISDVLML